MPANIAPEECILLALYLSLLARKAISSSDLSLPSQMKIKIPLANKLAGRGLQQLAHAFLLTKCLHGARYEMPRR